MHMTHRENWKWELRINENVEIQKVQGFAFLGAWVTEYRDHSNEIEAKTAKEKIDVLGR